MSFDKKVTTFQSSTRTTFVRLSGRQEFGIVYGKGWYTLVSWVVQHNLWGIIRVQ